MYFHRRRGGVLTLTPTGPSWRRDYDAIPQAQLQETGFQASGYGMQSG